MNWLRLVKREMISYLEIINKMLILAAHEMSRDSSRRRKSILICGDLGYGTGPYSFLQTLCNQLKQEYSIALIFRNSQISPSVDSFCRNNNLALFKMRSRRDFFDLLCIWFLTVKRRPSRLIINVGIFGKYLHLLALKTPSIYYNHSIWHPSISQRAEWQLKAFLKPPHRVVTVSLAAQKSLLRQYFQDPKLSDRLSWIYSGIEDRSSGKKGESSRLIISTLGSVAWYKNPELWLRIAKKVLKFPEASAAEFWWVGQGELLNKMRQEARKEDRVRFLGFSTQPDDVLIKSSIYFQPSKFESFGLGVCEAMMFSLPCVVTDCGGVVELVENGKTGFVVPEWEEEIMVDKLLTLIRSEALRKEMGTKARLRYLEHFTVQEWRREMLLLLNMTK